MGAMSWLVIDGVAAARRTWRVGWLAAALLPSSAVLLWAAAARPAMPPAPEAAPTQDTAETELAICVRRALVQEETLASINIGVTVHGGAVTLWGPIPSAELARQAVAKARQVAGVREVRSELSIVPRDGDVPDQPSPPEVAAADKLPLPPGALTGRPSEAAPAPAVTSVSLLPPIIASEPAADPGRPPPASLGHPVPLPPSTPNPPPAAPADLPSALDALRRGEERFGRIQWEVRDRVVTLRGTVCRGEDVMAFAQAVARVPGVERVIVGPVRVDPLAGSR
jgi:hypothetical protein